jgi:hypothetical protein
MKLVRRLIRGALDLLFGRREDISPCSLVALRYECDDQCNVKMDDVQDILQCYRK